MSLGARDRASAAVATALAGDWLERVLFEHRPVWPASTHCACGWMPALKLNDAESRGQHRAHVAAAIRTTAGVGL